MALENKVFDKPSQNKLHNKHTSYVSFLKRDQGFFRRDKVQNPPPVKDQEVKHMEFLIANEYLYAEHIIAHIETEEALIIKRSMVGPLSYEHIDQE